MRPKLTAALFALAALTAAGLLAGAAAPPAAAPDWTFNATIIEACSCPMFCQCYFSHEPAAMGGHEGHAAEHYCRFNNAFKINKAQYGSVKLDGVKFWISGDLGAEFSDGEMDWAVLTFDKSTPAAQRDAIAAIAGKLYPVKWKSFTTAEGSIDTWEASKDMAVAKLDGGKTAEVRLKRFQGMSNDPIVITNLKYWGAPRNDGFILMPNEVEAYRVGDKPYEYKGTNGFMITLDAKSSDFN
jgi:hypothetical protein